MKIYVASSWKNQHQPGLIKILRSWGHDVYDFRDSGSSFDWREELSSDYRGEEIVDRYRNALGAEIAKEAFFADFEAMRWADLCVLLLPCGRSAHIEAGWMVGAGKRLIVYIPSEPVVCSTCEGDGSRLLASVPYEEMKNSRAGDIVQHKASIATCVACEGTGRQASAASAFETELMYLIGGGPEIIVKNETELVKELGHERRS